MDAGAILLAAILDDPDDDLPRLALADWLEEAGQPERAGFIRAQMRLAGMAEPEYSGGACSECRKAPPEPCPFHALRVQLCRSYKPDRAGVPASFGVVRPRLSWFRRGFMEEVEMDAADWLVHREAVCAAHPVRRATLRRLRLVQARPGRSAGPEPPRPFAWRLTLCPSSGGVAVADRGGLAAASGQEDGTRVFSMVGVQFEEVAFDVRRGVLSLPGSSAVVEVTANG